MTGLSSQFHSTIQLTLKSSTSNGQLLRVLKVSLLKKQFLKKNNIEASAHFDPPLHQQKYLKKYSKKLPNTEKLAKEIITLPIYPILRQNDLNRIFKVIKNWYKKTNK